MKRPVLLYLKTRPKNADFGFSTLEQAEKFLAHYKDLKIQGLEEQYLLGVVKERDVKTYFVGHLDNDKEDL